MGAAICIDNHSLLSWYWLSDVWRRTNLRSHSISATWRRTQHPPASTKYLLGICRIDFNEFGVLLIRSSKSAYRELRYRRKTKLLAPKSSFTFLDFNQCFRSFLGGYCQPPNLDSSTTVHSFSSLASGVIHRLHASRFFFSQLIWILQVFQ